MLVSTLNEIRIIKPLQLLCFFFCGIIKMKGLKAKINGRKGKT